MLDESTGDLALHKWRVSAPGRRALGPLLLCLASALLLGCGGSGHADDCAQDAGGCPDASPLPYANWPDPLEGLPHGKRQNDATCKRIGDDRVADVFCADEPADIASLKDLQQAFQFYTDELGGFHGVALAGHSLALSSRSVSAINPRAIFIRLEAPMGSALSPDGPVPDDMMAMAFVRGEQFVELILRDRVSRELQFYVIGFRQACNDRRDGCHPGDLLTPAIERDWTEVTIYDEEALRNTVMDCAPCHQPDGPGSHKLVRMNELHAPWSHWFSRDTEGGKALLSDYMSAKADEKFAGLGREQVLMAHPGNLTMMMYFSGYEQPVLFPSGDIEAEVKASAERQPSDNSTPGESDTWRALYETSKHNGTMPVPYHDVKVTDEGKLAAMTRAYRAFRTGELEANALPDIRDVYPDDPELLARMGMMTEPGLSGREVLTQACALCHNARLDQSLSRANFRADLKGLDRKAKDTAIERLRLPPSDPRAMPPARLRSLSDEARERAIKALLK